MSFFWKSLSKDKVQWLCKNRAHSKLRTLLNDTKANLKIEQRIKINLFSNLFFKRQNKLTNGINSKDHDS